MLLSSTVVLALLKSFPFFCCGLSYYQEWGKMATSLFWRGAEGA